MALVKRFSLFLLPSVIQTFISLLMLPIITYVLGPEEFGIFALFTSLTGLGTVIASMGGGYLAAAHFQILEHSEKKRMVTTMVTAGFCIAILFSLLIMAFWPVLSARFDFFAAVPYIALLISLLGMILSIPWVFSIDIITLEGRAALFAATIITQSLITACATIVSLYIFKLGLLSLFIGSAAGACIAFIGAVRALYPHFNFIFSKMWFKKFISLGIKTLPANFLESFHVLIERSILSARVGLSQLGLYTHSQQYKTMMMMAIKAGARTVWPITLSEAREAAATFSLTKKAWDLAYMGITAGGVLFATFGREIIGILTNGKFIDAHLFVVFWMIFLLIQNAGKPHTGILWASEKGAVYAGMQFASTLFGIAMLILLVPLFGAWGAIAAAFLQMSIFRLLIQWRVSKQHAVPFQEQWVIGGSAIILITWLISWYFRFGILENILLLIAMYAVICAFGRHRLRELYLKL